MCSRLSAAHIKAKQKLTVSENKVLKEIFGHKGEKIIGRCRNYTRGPGNSVGTATDLRAESSHDDGLYKPKHVGAAIIILNDSNC